MKIRVVSYEMRKFNSELRTQHFEQKNGAGGGIRTRDLNLGKVALYQLSYTRIRQNIPQNVFCRLTGQI